MLDRRLRSFVACFTVALLLSFACTPSPVVHPPAAHEELSATNAGVVPPLQVNIAAPGNAPTIPPDIYGGAPNATLTQAALFAWQEFIAATWPAQPNGASFNRDTPDPNGIYGATAASPSGAPLVWETFRHKVEIFPGTTSPLDYTKNAPPHGATPGGAPTFGYNDPPQYDYGMINIAPNGQPAQYVSAVTGPCNGGDPNNTPTAWVNADENSQIFLDTMYAGVLGPTGTQPSSSQELLFLAKGNHVQYQYILNPANFGASQLYQALWNHSFNTATPPMPPNSDNPLYNTTVTNFLNYQTAVLNGQAATLQAPYVSFPAGTVEAKSAWRPLTPSESASGRFHMAMVRTYSSTGIANQQACWQQQPWGMVALHIIQKTPTAPYFIYATFSQADNIMNTSGQPVEDADGNTINTPNQPSTGSALDTGLTTPGQNPVSATLATPTTLESYNVTPPQDAQCQAGSRLYLVNSSSTVVPQGPICVNARSHPIPSEIINVNKLAHQAITSYNTSYNHGQPTPWLYYKLVNVQAAPINKTPGVIYTGANAATFYQSNDVVETNFNLQFFSGRLVSTSPSNGALTSDYGTNGKPFQNVFYLHQPNGSQVTTFNMGGCMGCHGNAQQAADDFSFILNVGRNDAPEPLPPPTLSATAKAAETARKVLKFSLPQ